MAKDVLGDIAFSLWSDVLVPLWKLSIQGVLISLLDIGSKRRAWLTIEIIMSLIINFGRGDVSLNGNLLLV